MLDPDVAERIEAEALQRGKTVAAVANEVLRTGLGLRRRSSLVKPFRVEPHDFGFRPELDLDKMNQLLDELEASEAAEKLRV